VAVEDRLFIGIFALPVAFKMQEKGNKSYNNVCKKSCKKVKKISETKNYFNSIILTGVHIYNID
jgi:hypothetical protein